MNRQQLKQIVKKVLRESRLQEQDQQRAMVMNISKQQAVGANRVIGEIRGLLAKFEANKTPIKSESFKSSYTISDLSPTVLLNDMTDQGQRSQYFNFSITKSEMNFGPQAVQTSAGHSIGFTIVFNKGTDFLDDKANPLGLYTRGFEYWSPVKNQFIPFDPSTMNEKTLIEMIAKTLP